MAKSERFADSIEPSKVAARFGKGVKPAKPSDDDEQEDEASDDIEKGNLLKNAIKNGDPEAICEAVRNIVND